MVGVRSVAGKIKINRCYKLVCTPFKYVDALFDFTTAFICFRKDSFSRSCLNLGIFTHSFLPKCSTSVVLGTALSILNSKDLRLKWTVWGLVSQCQRFLLLWVDTLQDSGCPEQKSSVFAGGWQGELWERCADAWSDLQLGSFRSWSGWAGLHSPRELQPAKHREPR